MSLFFLYSIYVHHGMFSFSDNAIFSYFVQNGCCPNPVWQPLQDGGTPISLQQAMSTSNDSQTINHTSYILPKQTHPQNTEIAIFLLAGYGRFHLFVLLATGGALMCVIVETMEMMFIIPAAQCDLELSLAEKGLLSSISFLGVFTSSHFWGFIADTRGRRKTLLISLCVSFVTSAASSLVPNDWMLILLRYINGIL